MSTLSTSPSGPATLEVRGRLWRSRWAAVGAAVAVTLGAGGLAGVNAASSAPSSTVTVDPCRLLDTRQPGTVDFGDGVTRTIQVTGNCAVPAAATALEATVTAVNAAGSQGFLTVWASGARPNTSTLNWKPVAGATANTTTIPLASNGSMQMYTMVDADVIVDVIGYHTAAGAGNGTPGPQGPAGAAGAQGPAGTQGPSGPAGRDASSLAHVLTVSPSGGDHTTIEAAVAEINDAGDNTAADPYVIVVGPGVFEVVNVTVPSNTTLRGSGPQATTIVIPASANVGLRVGGDAVVTVADVSIAHDGVVGGVAGVDIGASADVTLDNVDIRVSVANNASGWAMGVRSLGVADNIKLTVRDSNIVATHNWEFGTAYGLLLEAADLTVENSTVTANGADSPTAVQMSHAMTATIDNSTLVANGAYSTAFSAAMYTAGQQRVDVTNSTLRAATVQDSAGSVPHTATFRNSTLDGALDGSPTVGGVLACSNVLDASFEVRSADCTPVP